MNAIAPREHKTAAGRLRELLAKYEEVELLVKIGEYKKGTDAVADEALAKIGAIRDFLRQGLDEKMPFADAVARLQALAGA